MRNEQQDWLGDEFWSGSTPDCIAERLSDALEKCKPLEVANKFISVLQSFPTAKRFMLDPCETIISRLHSKDRLDVALMLTALQPPCMQTFVLWYVREHFSSKSLTTLLDRHAVNLLAVGHAELRGGHKCEWCRKKEMIDVMSYSISDIASFCLRADDPVNQIAQLASSPIPVATVIAIRAVALAHGVSFETCRLAITEELDDAAARKIRESTTRMMVYINVSDEVIRLYPFCIRELEQIRNEL